MCTSPNVVIWSGKYDYDGNPKLDFIGKVPYEKLKFTKGSWIDVPCGQCLECRIQQARTWADRVILESKQYKHNYFVTLTYADEYIPSNGSLKPDDMSMFIRYLRRKFPDSKIRFFGCGEYGDLSRRPHLHLILFNCPLDDLTYEFKEWDYQNNRYIRHLRPNNNGDLKYSQTIMDAWMHKGMISVGEVTYDSAAYVSQYVTKKHKPGMKEFYDKCGIEPEFVRMSTHPGIGHEYYEKNSDHLVLDDHKIIIPSRGEAHLSIPPRYYDKLFIKKYGQDIFDKHVRKRRLVDKLSKRSYVDDNGISKDLNNLHRDYKVKQKHKLRDQL